MWSVHLKEEVTRAGLRVVKKIKNERKYTIVKNMNKIWRNIHTFSFFCSNNYQMYQLPKIYLTKFIHI